MLESRLMYSITAIQPLHGLYCKKIMIAGFYANT
nr:MAG TPA: hypothetical protein [Caudoviricetes sp.]